MEMANKDNLIKISETTKTRYMQKLGEQVHELRAAMERSDFLTVREICHRVRGSANLFGLKDLGIACRDVEEACIANRPEAIVNGFQVIEVMIGRHLDSAEITQQKVM